MYFTKEKVKKNARMLRIGMTDELAMEMLPELEGVIEWIKSLDEVDVEGIEPMTSPADHPLSKRTDTIRAENTRDEVLSGAPAKDAAGEYFTVPKIIE
ncbi:MAG: Asp-tRNA(Asn)/Glu-tRNA(Gln) amidotransferase subunit GatC [Rickettsiales bacterium]|jgi:aspartyl-tRNA(Asn)/glutamyl-tRNA(Gln) amidotransferase subunit C|nr:Asp-tRNA(Asn)/Glu-tRNA(Gln) amidotransferase subunit GatC [Rickettsiales bacterium]